MSDEWEADMDWRDRHNIEDEKQVLECQNCGHDIMLHDSLGCEVSMGKPSQCRCKMTPRDIQTEQLGKKKVKLIIDEQIGEIGFAAFLALAEEIHSIDTERLRCSCGERMCFSCGGCWSQCHHNDKETRQ